MSNQSIDLFVACGDGSATIVHTDFNTYREVFDYAEQLPNLGYLINSGQVNATAIDIKRTELFDATHWFATREHKSVGFAYAIEVTHESRFK